MASLSQSEKTEAAGLVDPRLAFLGRPTTYYVLAILLLALAAIASHAVLVYSLSELDEDSLVINTSGRQRMLSEQTFRLARELVASEEASDAQALKEQLAASLSLMRDSHERLARDVQNSGGVSSWHLDLQAAYFEGASPLDVRMRAYFDALGSLLASPAEALSSDGAAYQSIARTHREGLLRDLDQVVQLYEGKAQANLEASERLHIYLMLAMLTLLLLEALFVFRPLIQRQVLANEELLDARDEAHAELAARTHVLAAVSHEIRTPLGGVLGIIDQLKHERSPVERERALLLIEDSCEVLLDTLDAILRQSRLGEGAENLSENLFSPPAVAHRVAELFRPVARRKALRIEVNSATDRKARGDDGRIQQFLANLVSNSVKFTQSGAITIYVQEPGSGTKEWAFVVADTGAGMDKKRVESLFEPFGHSSDDTLGRARGAGLGLSITRDLVEAMGGRIEVESEPGKGSSFTVLIPLGDPPERSENEDEEAQNGFVGLLIDRASDSVQAEAVATQCGYATCDLGASDAPHLPEECELTIIVDAILLPEIAEDVVSASQRIIVLGDNPPDQSDAAREKAVYVSHNQLARSLSEILKGRAS
ncbi:MAG: ATP-binding protein [Pseudomonadota bacterium]